MHPTTETVVTVITDPIADEESRHVLRSLRGFVTAQGSPFVDGTPTGSRSVFRLDHADLAGGGLEARIDTLTSRGIAVHRVLGEHPAVDAANSRLGYV